VLCVGYHGTSGPMKIADLQLTPLVEAFLDAGRELSYEVLDVNGPNQLGGWNRSVSVDWFICYWTPCTCLLAGNSELHSDEISSIVNPWKPVDHLVLSSWTFSVCCYYRSRKLSNWQIVVNKQCHPQHDATSACNTTHFFLRQEFCHV